MNATERHRLASHAAECGRSLNRLLREVFDYDRRKGFSRKLFRLYDSNAELWEGLEEDWESNAYGMLAAGAVLGSRQNAAGFVRSAGDRLAPRDLELARRWRTEPWHYAVYRVKADLGEELSEIEELQFDGAGGIAFGHQSILSSQSSARQYREGKGLLFSLLWWNGQCFQTYGPVIAFASFVPEDFLFFAREIAAARAPRGKVQLDTRPIEPLSRAIATDPVPFLGLFRFSEAPGMRNREAPMVYCDGWASVGDVGFEEVVAASRASEVPVASAGSTETAGRIRFGEGSPMYDPTAYLALDSRRLHLVAMSEEAYDRGRRALAAVVELPRVAQRRCSFGMYGAAHQILGGTSEADRLDAACAVLDEATEAEEDEAAVNGDALPTKEEAEAIFNRLVQNQNEGISEDDDAIASALGVDPAVVTHFHGQVADLLERMERNIPTVDRFGLSPDDFAALLKRGLPDRPGVLRLRGLEEYADAKGLDDLVEAAPLVACSRWLLGKLREAGGARATQTGNLPTALVREAHASPQFRTPEETIYAADESPRGASVPRSEKDWPFLRELRRTLEKLDLVSLERGRFRATPSGVEHAAEPLRLHRLLTEELLSRLEWRMGREELPTLAPLDQAAGFLLYAARKLTASAGQPEWIATRRLTDVFLGAHPQFRREEKPKTEERRAGDLPPIDLTYLIHVILDLRFLQFFAVGLGLVNARPLTTKGPEGAYETEFRTSELFDILFAP